jgi:uncharacterized protein YjiS (DUF1127 family)
MTQAIIVVSNMVQDALTGLVDLVREWKHARAAKAQARITHRELSKLTNHELKDMGIGRSDITSIANGTWKDGRRINEDYKNRNGWT